MFTCKPYEIDSDMPIFPSSEDDHVGYEHFLVEPGCREDWVSGLLDLDALQIEKCFNIEDIAGTFDCDQIKFDLDVVQPRLSKEEGINPEFPSETSQETFTRVHGEYHFDAKQINEAGDSTCRHQKEVQVENSGVKKQSLIILETESVGEMVDLSSVSVPVLKKKTDNHYSSIDQAVEKDIHEAFENSALFINKDWSKAHDLSSGFNSYSEFDSGPSLIKYEAYSDENGDITAYSSVDDYSFGVTDLLTGSQKHPNVSQDRPMKRKKTNGCESIMTATSVSRVEMCSIDEEDQAGQLVSRKRARKPPKRYIEESLEYEFKPFNKRCGVGKKPKDRLVQDRYPKQKWQKEFPVDQVEFEDDSFTVGCIQVPFGAPVEKECPKKNKPSPARSSEDLKNNTKAMVPLEKIETEPLSVVSQEDFSEDECVTRISTPKGNYSNSNNIRRKRHISWTPEEVVMLVDGVAQCGVGRWTEIKRLLFSSSSHRTSVDLKDKWRNLLRASCTQLQIKEKVEQGRKQSPNYVSESILWRVKELAVLYPYPRENRAKISCTIPAFQPRGSNALVPLSTVV